MQNIVMITERKQKFNWLAYFHWWLFSVLMTEMSDYTLFHEIFSTFFKNKISLPERRNKRKSVLEITKMYYV